MQTPSASAPRALSFDRAAAAYAANRPGYPPALFDTIEELSGRPLKGARTVDVGAGTGIATRLLQAGGALVTADSAFLVRGADEEARTRVPMETHLANLAWVAAQDERLRRHFGTGDSAHGTAGAGGVPGRGAPPPRRRLPGRDGRGALCGRSRTDGRGGRGGRGGDRRSPPLSSSRTGDPCRTHDPPRARPVTGHHTQAVTGHRTPALTGHHTRDQNSSHDE